MCVINDPPLLYNFKNYIIIQTLKRSDFLTDAWNEEKPVEVKASKSDKKVVETVNPSITSSAVIPPGFEMFEPAIDIPSVRSFKLLVMGMDKQGKTWLILNAPRPLYLFDTENKADVAVKQLPVELQKDVYILNIMQKVRDADGNFDKVAAIDYIYDVLQKVKNLEHGTIGFDSYSAISSWVSEWFNNSPEILKDTKTGKPYRFEFGKAKAKYLAINELLQQTKMNLVASSWVKPAVSNKGEDLGYNVMDAKKNSGYFFEFYGEIMKIGPDRKFIVRGSNYGNMEGFEIENPTFDSIKEAISKHTGVEFFK